MVPLTTTPGGNPVTELPGLSARFPTTIVGPVLVTVEPPKTVTSAAAPRLMVWATADQEVASSPETINAAANAASDLRVLRVALSAWTRVLTGGVPRVVIFIG